ncbi:hypothetical protein BDR07DRAFT_1491076 [Suillus spraguei]|nr:hypothetical protein BDR07DRAFT_1491076 [Suillus spraguei]
MTIVSDDPAVWPLVRSSRLSSYFVAAGSTVVVYDWALTFGQEFELILSQRWSFMTILYTCVRYIGILVSVINLLWNLPIPNTDLYQVNEFSGTIIWYIEMWTPVIVYAMLGVVMIARINALYQGSKKLFIFLVVFLLACTIISVVMVVLENSGIFTQEFVLAGFHTCNTFKDTNLIVESLIPTSVWEILALLLTVWIVVKHFRELRQSPTGSSIGNCLKMLTESHVFYFLAFATVASLRLGPLSNVTNTTTSIGSAITLAFGQLPSIREHYAKVLAGAGGTSMSSIAFQAGGGALTGRDVSTSEDV